MTWEQDSVLSTEHAGKKEKVTAIITAKLEEVKAAQQTGQPTSIIIPGEYSDITPLGQHYNNHYDYYVQKYWEKLPHPKSTRLSQDLSDRRIEDYISRQIQTVLGNATFPPKNVRIPNTYGAGSHWFYLTAQPLTTFHVFGWEIEGVGGGIDLVTINIPFEKLIQWSSELKQV